MRLSPILLNVGVSFLVFKIYKYHFLIIVLSSLFILPTLLFNIYDVIKILNSSINVILYIYIYIYIWIL